VNDVATVLHRALSDEPPLRLDPDDLLALGRRDRRRRRLALATTTAAVVVMASAVTASLQQSPAGTSPVAVAPGGWGAPAVPDTVTEHNLAEVVAQQLEIEYREVVVHGRDQRAPGLSTMNLSAAVDDPVGDTALTLHFLAANPDKPRRGAPHCGDGSSFGNPGEGPAEDTYVGSCNDYTLESGAALEVKDLRSDAYAKVQAILVRPDGSTILAQSTNQDSVDPKQCVETETGKDCPMGEITRPTTGVSAQALGDLLASLEPATR